MRALGSMFGSLFGFIVIGVVVYLLVQSSKKKGGSVGGVRRSDIRYYAKRYRKKFPDTKVKSMRESLRQEFLPERIGKRSTDSDMAGCFLFGLGGMMAASAGHGAAAAMGDAEIDRIKDLIEEVLEDLYDEDDA